MIEATLGVSGPTMDPRRGEYADFPATAGDLDDVNDDPEAPPVEEPDERPRRARKTN